MSQLMNVTCEIGTTISCKLYIMSVVEHIDVQITIYKICMKNALCKLLSHCNNSLPPRFCALCSNCACSFGFALSAIIGFPCSGDDGLLLLLVIWFSVMMMNKKNKVQWMRWSRMEIKHMDKVINPIA